MEDIEGGIADGLTCLVKKLILLELVVATRAGGEGEWQREDEEE